MWVKHLHNLLFEELSKLLEMLLLGLAMCI